MSPLPAAKRKRRFAKIEGDYIEDVDSDDEDDDAENEGSEASESTATETVVESTENAG
jgi:hypothetical protein